VLLLLLPRLLVVSVVVVLSPLLLLLLLLQECVGTAVRHAIGKQARDSCDSARRCMCSSMAQGCVVPGSAQADKSTQRSFAMHSYKIYIWCGNTCAWRLCHCRQTRNSVLIGSGVLVPTAGRLSAVLSLLAL
jgi:hypothetical protein